MQPFDDTPDPREFELEARLRAERPRPSAELIARLAAEPPRRRLRGGLTVRLAVATALTAVLAVAALTAGGGSPLRAFDDAKNAATGTSNSSNSGPGSTNSGTSSPGKDQYGNKVTICHRGNSQNNPGETLTLPQQAAEAHLRQHRFDTRGPCPPPPPPKVTICHRTSKNDKGQTLTLPQQAAESHLRQHKYDTRGPCKK
jgi:hypothetical protein